MAVPLIPIALTAVLTALATAGFIELETKKTDAGYTINAQGKPIFTLPNEFFLAEKSVDELQQPLKRIRAVFLRTASTGTSKPTIPNISIKVPFKSAILLSFAVRPDAVGKTNGNAEFYVNQNDLLLQIPDTSLTDVDVLNLPIPTEGLTIVDNSTTIDGFWWSSGAEC